MSKGLAQVSAFQPEVCGLPANLRRARVDAGGHGKGALRLRQASRFFVGLGQVQPVIGDERVLRNRPAYPSAITPLTTHVPTPTTRANNGISKAIFLSGLFNRIIIVPQLAI